MSPPCTINAIASAFTSAPPYQSACSSVPDLAERIGRAPSLADGIKRSPSCSPCSERSPTPSSIVPLPRSVTRRVSADPPASTSPDRKVNVRSQRKRGRSPEARGRASEGTVGATALAEITIDTDKKRIRVAQEPPRTGKRRADYDLLDRLLGEFDFERGSIREFCAKYKSQMPNVTHAESVYGPLLAEKHSFYGVRKRSRGVSKIKTGKQPLMRSTSSPTSEASESQRKGYTTTYPRHGSPAAVLVSLPEDKGGSSSRTASRFSEGIQTVAKGSKRAREGAGGSISACEYEDEWTDDYELDISNDLGDIYDIAGADKTAISPSSHLADQGERDRTPHDHGAFYSGSQLILSSKPLSIDVETANSMVALSYSGSQPRVDTSASPVPNDASLPFTEAHASPELCQPAVLSPVSPFTNIRSSSPPSPATSHCADVSPSSPASGNSPATSSCLSSATANPAIDSARSVYIWRYPFRDQDLRNGWERGLMSLGYNAVEIYTDMLNSTHVVIPIVESRCIYIYNLRKRRIERYVEPGDERAVEGCGWAIYLLEQSLRYGLRDLYRAEAFKAEKSGRPIAVKKQDYGAQWMCYDVEKEYALQLYGEGRLAVVRAST